MGILALLNGAGSLLGFGGVKRVQKPSQLHSI
jgi:hypothetical protein